MRVELYKPGAGGRELVEIRGVYVLAAVESDVFPAEIIRDDIKDVWFISVPRAELLAATSISALPIHDSHFTTLIGAST